MTTLTIRNIDETTRVRLKVLAATNGRSMEAELREIVAKATSEVRSRHNIGKSIHKRFKKMGGVELAVPPRSKPKSALKFER